MKLKLPSGNRRKQSDRMRLPLILLVLIVGALVSVRWMREMRANHEFHRLAGDERALMQDVLELNRDIGDLKGRFRSLINRSEMDHRLSQLGVKMDDIKLHTPIEVFAQATESNNPQGGDR